MSRLRVLAAGEVCQIYRRDSPAGTFVMRKQTPEGGRTVIVPNHGEIRRGTFKSIIDQSGQARSLFMN